MAKEWIITFTMEATRLACMPLDMMRYDRVTPLGQQDVSELACIDIPREPNDPPVRVEFLRQAHGDKNWKPTHERWITFGWKLVKVDPPRSF